MTGSQLNGYKSVATSESALLNAVSMQPIAVAVAAGNSAFQFYSSGMVRLAINFGDFPCQSEIYLGVICFGAGILDSTRCGQNLDHAVLAVGFGTESKNYWIVKNSWFVRARRPVTAACLLILSPAFLLLQQGSELG